MGETCDWCDKPAIGPCQYDDCERSICDTHAHLDLPSRMWFCPCCRDALEPTEGRP